ncbi:MAG TPA: hypothetical protein VFT45_04540 [Longimicrobium sp.]|nr:hypothetical protein [Longimicrobium sp.]
MRSWLAAPLRRFAGTAVMVAAAHAGAFRALQANPELPPAGVDRVEVMRGEGSRVITDRTAIARIVALVGSYPAEWTRYPDTVCLLGSPNVAFYEGDVYWGSITLGTGAIVLNSHQGTYTRMLTPRDAAELQRLAR